MAWRCLVAAIILAAGAQAEHICPRAATPPTLDGKLNDVCWATALKLADFTRPKSKDRPSKGVEARLCFDDKALYVAFVCAEPHPERIKAEKTVENDGVWQDDCVEVWVRTTNSSLEHDQFIVNTLGTRQSVRRRQSGAGGAWRPGWQAKVAREPRRWVVEMRIPFADLELAGVQPGDMVEIKLGREDHTAAGVVLSTWPPESSYAGFEDYAPLYFERANVLPNPDMSQRDGARVASWGFGKNDGGLFSSVVDGKRRVIRFACPGRYSTVQQSLRLKPNARYRLEAEVKGTAGIYLRARTERKIGGPSVPHTANVEPSDVYKRIEVPFPTGPSGRALIILGNTETGGKGEALIADLKIVREAAFDVHGPAIPLRPVEQGPTVVTKLLVDDCRALRGFVGAPVDGTTASGDWSGQTWEYGQPGAGAGVGYAYRNNDGLHITLADRKGFHAVQIRGGARVKLYRDCRKYWDPASGQLLAELPGRSSRSRLWFEKPVHTRHVSFFDLADGRIADVSFFRVSQGLGELKAPLRTAFFAGSPAPALPPGLNEQFGKDDRTVFGVAGDVAKQEPFRPRKGQTFHLVPMCKPGGTLGAVGLDLDVADAPSPAPFTAIVHDPLNLRRRLLEADLLLPAPGRCRVVLDVPDQILLEGAQVWVSLRFDVPVTLASLAVDAYAVEGDRARREALAWRKLLLKTCFCALSEARPWTGWYDDRRMAASLADKRWGPQLKELVATLGHCKRLGPDDDLVRQYDEWIYRNYRPRRATMPTFEPKIDAIQGAPEWAVVARQAWLSARGVAKWWVEERMVPTGELGGLVGDDSDLYQNFADLPMFETDGVAAMVRDGAERLMALAEKDTLEQGLNRRTMDPLHAYEEGVNHEALLAWWNYGDPVAMERCIVAARSTEALTVLTAKGHRHFKSQDCGAADLKMDRKTDTDGHAHPLMWHPTFEVAWYTRNPRALEHLTEWADGWLAHMQPGKYATSVEVATERVTATTHRPLYGGYGSQGSAFLFLYWITDEAKYLEPFLEQFRKGSRNTSPHLILPELIHRHGLASLGPKLSEAAKGEGASETLLTGDKGPLIDALKRDIAELQRFPAMYTTAEPFTDRVFLYALRNAAVCYTGGYASRNKFHHTHAVSWEGFGTDYAALVLKAKRNSLKVLVYSFATKPMDGILRCWTLDHGQYALRTGPDANGDDAMDSAVVDRSIDILRATAVPLTLPPKTVTVVELLQTHRRDDARLRADLALSPSEIHVEDGVVKGVAHNIGSRRVESFDIALVDGKGVARFRKAFGPLDAPLDLVPKRLDFAIAGLPAQARGWAVVIDPGGKVAEIFEGNNRAPVPAR